MSAAHVWFGVGRAKVALDQVGRDAQPGQADRGPPALACHYSGDSGGLHQPLDSLSPDPDAVLQAELGVDPPRRRRCRPRRRGSA